MRRGRPPGGPRPAPAFSPRVRPPPAPAFPALAGPFGLFFALATPPHDPPDEARHHARAWLVSSGRLGVVGEAPGHAASVPREITQLHRPGHHYSEEQLRGALIGPTAKRTAPHDPAELRS